MINKAYIIGRLGGDPETRYMPSGSAVTNCTVATDESWKDKEGNKQEKTEWHRVVFFGKLAEISGEYLKKGSLVYIEGSLQTRQWERDGQKHHTTEIRAREMKMLGAKDSSDREAVRGEKTPDLMADFDDDIPF